MATFRSHSTSQLCIVKDYSELVTFSLECLENEESIDQSDVFFLVLEIATQRQNEAVFSTAAVCNL